MAMSKTVIMQSTCFFAFELYWENKLKNKRTNSGSTKLGVHEGATHDVHVVVRGVGARVGGIEQSLRGEGFEVKERVRELIKAMGDTNELLPF